MVQCVADTHISAGVNTVVRPDFHTGSIHVLLRQGLSGDSLLITLHHELHHALQYFLWMQTPATDLWAERLTLLAGMMKPGKLNGSYQARANLKKHPRFKNASRRWLQAYTNVFFCMEYQAYMVEARYVEAIKPDMRLVSEHVRQHLAGKTDAISQFLNGDVVKKYWDSEFTQKQLALAEVVCPASNNPVDMFRASVKALGING